MDGALTGGTYEIVIGAVLDEDWSAWFNDFEVHGAGTTTVLRGTVADQAALHGLLARLRDLGVALLDVHRVDSASLQGGRDSDHQPGPADVG